MLSILGNPARTLVEKDTDRFRRGFEEYAAQQGYEIRKSEMRPNTET